MNHQPNPKNPMEWPITYEEVQLATLLAFAAKSDDEKLQWLEETFAMVAPFLEPNARSDPGRGDYTQERQAWLKDLSVDDVAQNIVDRRQEKG